MREIKFRGFQKSWIYGGISVFENEATIFDVNCVANSAYEVDIKSIGQFTGLSDRYGVEIYEGDFVANGYGTVSLVEFYKDGFWINSGQKGAYFELRNQHNFLQVLGNIFENPEMLLGGQAIT